MDIALAQSGSDNAAWLHLLNLDRTLMYADPEKIKPVRLKLKNVDSDEWAAEQARQVREAQKKNRQFKGKYDAPLEEIKVNNRKLYASVVVGFENLTYNGQTPNKAQVIELFEKNPDILEQVQNFVDDRANFTSGALAA